MSAVACPSELVLDRHFVGELTDASLTAHLAGCARCTERIAERERLAASFASDVGLDVLVGAAARTVRRNRLRPVLIGAGALAAAAAVVLVVTHKPSEDDVPTVRTKGGLSLGLVAKHLDGRIEALTSPAQLAPGEAIEFELSTRVAGFVGVVGVDAAGVISPYVPSRRLAAGGHQMLDGSVVLDATLGAERIFAVMCETEIEMDVIVERARSALARVGGNPAQIELLALPATCSQTSFLIEKKSPP
jgi:hypothetical protein